MTSGSAPAVFTRVRACTRLRRDWHRLAVADQNGLGHREHDPPRSRDDQCHRHRASAVLDAAVGMGIATGRLRTSLPQEIPKCRMGARRRRHTLPEVIAVRGDRQMPNSPDDPFQSSGPCVDLFASGCRHPQRVRSIAPREWFLVVGRLMSPVQLHACSNSTPTLPQVAVAIHGQATHRRHHRTRGAGTPEPPPGTPGHSTVLPPSLPDDDPSGDETSGDHPAAEGPGGVLPLRPQEPCPKRR